MHIIIKVPKSIHSRLEKEDNTKFICFLDGNMKLRIRLKKFSIKEMKYQFIISYSLVLL